MIGTPQAPTEAIDFWLPVVVVFSVQTISFIFCSLKQDNGYVDVFWGWDFVLPLVALAISDGVGNRNGNSKELLIANPRFLIVLSCNLLWCLRLSIHIVNRHTVEDFRFKKMRD